MREGQNSHYVAASTRDQEVRTMPPLFGHERSPLEPVEECCARVSKDIPLPVDSVLVARFADLYPDAHEGCFILPNHALAPDQDSILAAAVTDGVSNSASSVAKTLSIRLHRKSSNSCRNRVSVRLRFK